MGGLLDHMGRPEIIGTISGIVVTGIGVTDMFAGRGMLALALTTPNWAVVARLGRRESVETPVD